MALALDNSARSISSTTPKPQDSSATLVRVTIVLKSSSIVMLR